MAALRLLARRMSCATSRPTLVVLVALGPVLYRTLQVPRASLRGWGLNWTA